MSNDTDFLNFHLIESSEFVDSIGLDFVSRRPFFCQMTDSGTQDWRKEASEIAKWNGQIGRFVRALRLLHSGRVYDPLDFVIYCVQGPLQEISWNSYGRAVYGLPVAYTLKRDEVQTLEGVYLALEAFDRLAVVPEAHFSEALFGHSYASELQEPVDRVLLLLGVVESLIGPGATSALAEARWPDPAVQTFVRRFKVLRDAVAHGGVNSSSSEDADLMEEIVRTLLRQVVALRITNAPTPAVFGRAFVRHIASLSEADLTPARLATLATGS